MIQYIEKNVSNIGTIAPSVSGREPLIYGSFNTSATVNGITPEYQTVRNLKIQE